MTNLIETISETLRAAPQRIVVYGPHGIGKSSFAASAERVVFIQTEDGLANIDAKAFPIATEYEHVIQFLDSLLSGEHEFMTLAVDSLDWLERLIFDRVCQDKNVKSIEDIGYAKGYHFALLYWREFVSKLNLLRSERGMQIILIAHAQIEKFQDPTADSYGRYSPGLHKYASALIQEWADEVLFANYRVHTKMVDEGFNRKRAQGIGTGERVLKTTERPSHVAKNRLGLPDELPLNFGAFARYRDSISSREPSNKDGAESPYVEPGRGKRIHTPRNDPDKPTSPIVDMTERAP